MYDGNVLGASTVAVGSTGAVLAVTGFEELAVVMGVAFLALATSLVVFTKLRNKA